MINDNSAFGGKRLSRWRNELVRATQQPRRAPDTPIASVIAQAGMWIHALHDLSRSSRPGAAAEGRDLNIRLTALLRQIARAKNLKPDLVIGNAAVAVLVERLERRDEHETA